MSSNLGKVVLNNTNRPMNNVIDGKRLREVQSKVLDDLKNTIVKSMGPAGSNTLIIRGASEADIVAEYSKDGNKIIKNIKYEYPIEMAIKSEIENATRHIEKEVGDGTSSVVAMSSFIFDDLMKADEDGILPSNPYEVMRYFSKAVKLVSDKIYENGRECTLEDIRDIALISTNGNEEIADTIYNIYKEYGMNVFIDVSASTNENTYLKTYNGVTIEAGYSDPAMINNLDRGTCRIRSTANNPVRVYHFTEPIDTPEQLALFQTIIETNIMEHRFPARGNATLEIPTVILVPQISRDAMAYMRRITQMLHQFNESQYSQKPQLLIVTNYMGLSENYVDHISNLCGCKPIRKYIDDKIQKADQDQGLAPTLNTVCDFYGTTGEVESDVNITKFVDPALMYKKDAEGNVLEDENGNFIYSDTYNNIVNFIEAEYKSQSSQAGSAGTLGALKRQLNAIKSNMVELFIGGISISDRDSLRDLVEDAVLNTRSAAANGVGFGANTMGYCASVELLSEYLPIPLDEENEKEVATMVKMLEIIHSAYKKTIKCLYATVYNDEEIDDILSNIFDKCGVPMNINTGKYDGKVLTSIASEPSILHTISKIISVMFSANQSILQAPSLASHY